MLSSDVPATNGVLRACISAFTKGRASQSLDRPLLQRHATVLPLEENMARDVSSVALEKEDRYQSNGRLARAPASLQWRAQEYHHLTSERYLTSPTLYQTRT